jgi:N-acetylmuramoyl-L-alanine amidase
MFPRIHLAALILSVAAPLSAAEPPAWSLEFSPHLATLGVAPDWSRLDPWQETMTREEFTRLLDERYAHAPGEWKPWIEITDTHAAITKETAKPEEKYLLRFAAAVPAKPPQRYWRAPRELPPATDAAQPLSGYRIALDPGHIGGEWARLEKRFFQIGEDQPVQEGDMVLLVARLLKSRLEALGAEVSLIRAKAEPVTRLRPGDVEAYTKKMLEASGWTTEIPVEVFEAARNRVFAVNAEIRARAALVNHKLKPDLVLALHFNGEPWGSPDSPVFSDNNHHHVLVYGNVEPWEWAQDDIRFETMIKLLQRTHEIETGLGTASALGLAKATGLPAFTYKGDNARPADDTGYVWARNLLASRLYQCPVVYLEPHVMNHKLTYQRIQAGPYVGKREIDGVERPNIFVEYADATTAAVVRWFKSVAKH